MAALPFKIIASTADNGDHNPTTTPTRDTRGASCIIIVLTGNNGAASVSGLDNGSADGNTYTSLGTAAGSRVMTRIYYCNNPKTSALHSWKDDGNVNNNFGSICVLALQGVLIAPTNPSDQSPTSGISGTSGTTDTVTSQTPTEDGVLAILGYGFDDPSLTGVFLTADSGFNLLAFDNSIAGAKFGGAMFYRLMTRRTAVAPTITRTVARNGTGSDAASLAFFRMQRVIDEDEETDWLWIAPASSTIPVSATSTSAGESLARIARALASPDENAARAVASSITADESLIPASRAAVASDESLAAAAVTKVSPDENTGRAAQSVVSPDESTGRVTRTSLAADENLTSAARAAVSPNESLGRVAGSIVSPDENLGPQVTAVSASSTSPMEWLGRAAQSITSRLENLTPASRSSSSAGESAMPARATSTAAVENLKPASASASSRAEQLGRTAATSTSPIGWLGRVVRTVVSAWESLLNPALIIVAEYPPGRFTLDDIQPRFALDDVSPRFTLDDPQATFTLREDYPA